MRFKKRTNQGLEKIGKRQIVLTAPSKKLIGTYLTIKGERLKKEGIVNLESYTKNRYRINDDSEPMIIGKKKRRRRLMSDNKHELVITHKIIQHH